MPETRRPARPAPATLPLTHRLTRRTFLKGSVAAGAAVAGGGLWTTAIQPRKVRAAETPIEHVVISMQENRSFDHYFGYAPQVQAAGFGPPEGYTQPNPELLDGAPALVEPYRFTALETPDVPHGWDAVHGQWNGGAMDGFMTHSGIWAMGYYTAQELPFYYSLFENSTLCVNFFCSLLGPTWPNRFYHMAGTSGGITTNGVWGYGIFDHPMILDLFDAAEPRVTWKTYSLGMDSVPYGNTDNVAVFWENFANDQRTHGSMGGFLNDCRKGRLPNVSFLIPSYARGWDEHPPASVQVGEAIQAECITALRNSPLWEKSAYIVTYDEHGGYFDHVEPPTFDAFGAGVRIPTWVISPWAKAAHLEPTMYEIVSILKFLERNFGLPTLASVNHLFDEGTPVGGNYQAADPNATVGPPAPPRDDIGDIGDLMECFTF